MIDLDSGEILEQWSYDCDGPVSGWYQQHQDAQLARAKDKRLTGTDRRVLDFVMAKMCYGNVVRLTQQYAADELGISRPEVSRSMKNLIATGWLRKAPIGGGYSGYIINSDRAWKGKSTSKRRVDASPLKLVVDNV